MSLPVLADKAQSTTPPHKQSADDETKNDDPQWKLVATMQVLDGRQYECDPEFNHSVSYSTHEIGRYIADEHCNFVCIPQPDRLPKLITNTASLNHQDLNQGFKQVEHIITKTQSFLDVAKTHFQSFDLEKAGIEFVTFRNNLNKIMAAAYNHSRPEYDAFAIDIIKRGSVIFLEIVDRKCILEKAKNDANDSKTDGAGNAEDALKPEWWGRRFEQLCTQNTKEENEQLILVTHSHLNRHEILMAAEIDCVDANGAFVEIKTQKYIQPKYQNNRQVYNANRERSTSKMAKEHRHHPYKQQKEDTNMQPKQVIIPLYKSLKIWIQSFLSGTNQIFVGFRDEKGTVVESKMLSLDWFQRKINFFDRKKQQKSNKSNVCLNLTDRVLEFIRQNCKSDTCVYRIVFNTPFQHLMLYTQQH